MKIDLTELESKREHLAFELKKIQHAIEVFKELQAQIEPLPTLTIATNNKPKKKNPFHQGLQRMILIHLWTGPALSQEIAKAIMQDEALVIGAIRSAAKRGFIVCDGNAWKLTALGKNRAQWFVDNPGYVHFTKRPLAREIA